MVLKRASPEPKCRTGQDYGLYYIGQRIKCGQGRLVSRQILQTSCRMCRFLLMMECHPFMVSGAPCWKSHPVVVATRGLWHCHGFLKPVGVLIRLHPLMKHPFHCNGCWYILHVRGSVHYRFRGKWVQLFHRQRNKALVECTHKIQPSTMVQCTGLRMFVTETKIQQLLAFC